MLNKKPKTNKTAKKMIDKKRPAKKQEDLWRDVLYSSDEKSIKQLLDILRSKGNTVILHDIIKLYKGYKNFYKIG